MCIKKICSNSCSVWLISGGCHVDVTCDILVNQPLLISFQNSYWLFEEGDFRSKKNRNWTQKVKCRDFYFDRIKSWFELKKKQFTKLWSSCNQKIPLTKNRYPIGRLGLTHATWRQTRDGTIPNRKTREPDLTQNFYKEKELLFQNNDLELCRRKGCY